MGEWRNLIKNGAVKAYCILFCHSYVVGDLQHLVIDVKFKKVIFLLVKYVKINACIFLLLSLICFLSDVYVSSVVRDNACDSDTLQTASYAHFETAQGMCSNVKKWKYVYNTCTAYCRDIPFIQTNSLKMPVASSFSLVIQLNFFSGFLV
jgi:hypothetical protein